MSLVLQNVTLQVELAFKAFFIRVNLDMRPDIQVSKERVDTTASRLMGFQGLGSLACGRAPTGPDVHGLAAAAQSRMAGTNVARVMEGDETVTSVQQSREAFFRGSGQNLQDIHSSLCNPSGWHKSSSVKVLISATIRMKIK
jgi:hypothetical protein